MKRALGSYLPDFEQTLGAQTYLEMLVRDRADNSEHLCDVRGILRVLERQYKTCRWSIVDDLEVGNCDSMVRRTYPLAHASTRLTIHVPQRRSHRGFCCCFTQQEYESLMSLCLQVNLNPFLYDSVRFNIPLIEECGH